MNPVTIKTVDTQVEIDPYRRDTQGLSRCSLWIHPLNRTAGVEQVYPGQNGIDSDVWHSRIITCWPDDITAEFPEETALTEYLNSLAAQKLLATVCDEHTIDWDGNNMIGHLSEAGDDALLCLLNGIAAIPTVDWEMWDVEDYFQHSLDAVTVDSTDEELATLVATWAAELPANVLINGDLSDLLTTHRQQLREDQVD
jgi:hypothetical protein